MIKINLLPEAKVSVGRRPEGGGAAAGGGPDINNILIIGLLVAGLLAAGYLWFAKYSKKKAIQAQITAQEEEYERLKPIIDQVRKYEARKLQLQQKYDLINTLRANQEGPVHLLDELADLVPDLLWLDRLTIRGTSLDVQGGALSPNAVAEFLQRLDDSPYFKEPSLRSMQEASNYHNFSLTCQFTYTPGKEKPAAPAAPKPKPARPPAGGQPPGAGDSLQ